MWPGRPALRRSTSRVRSATTSHGARHTAGIEVALHRLAGHALARHVERHPPVDADDVGAGLAHQPEQLAGAHAEVDAAARRWPRARRTPWRCAAARARA